MTNKELEVYNKLLFEFSNSITWNMSSGSKLRDFLAIVELAHNIKRKDEKILYEV